MVYPGTVPIALCRYACSSSARLPGFAEQHPKLGIQLLVSDRTEDLIAEGARGHKANAITCAASSSFQTRHAIATRVAR